MGRGLDNDTEIGELPRRNPFRQEIQSPDPELMQEKREEIAKRAERREAEGMFEERADTLLQEMIEDYRDQRLKEGFSLVEIEEELKERQGDFADKIRQEMSDEIIEETLSEKIEEGQERLDARYEYLRLEQGLSQYISPHILREGLIPEDFQVLVEEVDDPRERSKEGPYRFSLQRDPLSRLLAWGELFREVGADPLRDSGPDPSPPPGVRYQFITTDLEAREKMVVLDYLETVVGANQEEGVTLAQGYAQTAGEAERLGQEALERVLRENTENLKKKEEATRLSWEKFTAGQEVARENREEVKEVFAGLRLNHSGRTEEKRAEEERHFMESIRSPKRQDFGNWQVVTYIRNPNPHFRQFDFANLEKHKRSEIFLGVIFAEGQEEYIIRVEEDSGAVVVRPTLGPASSARKIAQSYPYMDMEEIQASVEELLPGVVEKLKREKG